MELTGLGRIPGVHKTQIVLAERLKEIAPPTLSGGRIAFCNTGAEATELSMLLVRVILAKYCRKFFIGDKNVLQNVFHDLEQGY